MKIGLLISIICILFGCKQGRKRVIVLQPLGNFSKTNVNQIKVEIEAINANVIVRENVVIPENAYYAPRNRYRADSLIRTLKNWIGEDSIIVGLLNEDISTTKNGIEDWGIMGLGYRPGNACVVSSFRLNKQNKNAQFFKLTLHEIGHTEGLSHCNTKGCYMKDAEGGNPLDDLYLFCKKCKQQLIRKKWVFN